METENGSGQEQTGQKVVISARDLCADPHQEHDQGTQAGDAGSDHQAVQDQKDTACQPRKGKTASGFPQEIIDAQAQKCHMQAGYGKQVADPALLVHSLHLGIQPALLPQKDRTHRSSVVIPQMPEEQFVPPAFDL